jgi:ATP-dependent DNA helicase RecQ
VVFDEIRRIRRLAPDTQLGDIAVLARTHKALEPLRSLCEEEQVRYRIVSPQETGGAVAIMQTREGHQALAVLARRRNQLVSTKAFGRWLNRRARDEPENHILADLSIAADDLAISHAGTKMTASEIADWLYEFSGAARRDGSDVALRLMTAHAAKGQEFKHVLVMDCGDWRKHEDDERRLLYVAITRAKETLTLFRARDNSNIFFSDLETAEAIVSVKPSFHPTFRAELQRRYVELTPKDVDLGYAGRLAPNHPAHAALAALKLGSRVQIDDRYLKTSAGVSVGRLAQGFEKDLPSGVQAKVSSVMVRTRSQTAAQYQAAVRVDRWEVVLCDIVQHSWRGVIRANDSRSTRPFELDHEAPHNAPAHATQTDPTVSFAGDAIVDRFAARDAR